MSDENFNYVKNIAISIPGENGKRCLKLLNDERERFLKAKGASVKHHYWEGGYIDHVSETMQLAYVFYCALIKDKKTLPFNLTDAYLVLFLHDLEKAWKYYPPHLKIKKDENENFRQEIISKYGFELSENHKNALRHIETEKDYSPTERKQGPLAAFCHSCDTISARIFFDGFL